MQRGSSAELLMKKFGVSGGTKIPSYQRSESSGNGSLFGKPLETLFAGDSIPVPLQDMLIRLYIDGPRALGLFRKSANARCVHVLSPLWGIEVKDNCLTLFSGLVCFVSCLPC